MMNLRMLILLLLAIFFFSCNSVKKNVLSSENGALSPWALKEEAVRLFPANEWVGKKLEIVLPEECKEGRHSFVNTEGSIVYCSSIGRVILFDGYTFSPERRREWTACSNSVYTFDPISFEFELIKRGNWRSGTDFDDPGFGTFPYDENKIDPTPCPRHVFHGMSWSANNNILYLINGSNGSLSKLNTKYKKNNGTTTRTFWSFDIEIKKWEELVYPPLQETKLNSTVLVHVPNTDNLVYLDSLSIASYDTKKANWKILKRRGDRSVFSLDKYCAVLFDSKRLLVVIYGGIEWRQQKMVGPKFSEMELQVYNIKKNEYEVMRGAGNMEFDFNVTATYLEKIDKYCFLTGKGLFLFDPNTKKWGKLKIDIPEDGRRFGYNYITYDRIRELIIISAYKNWYVLRLDENTLQYE